MPKTRLQTGIALSIAAIALSLRVAASPADAVLAAALTRVPDHAAILAVAHAGDRLVAVGDHGIVLLANAEPGTLRQAALVPTQALLTSVTFADERHGWAVGHDGVIIATSDAGNTWTLQHQDLQNDRPLLSVHFSDLKHGMAVGLFGAALRTDDGGSHWEPFTPNRDLDDDHHLFAIFGNNQELYITAEKGRIYRSQDRGATWDAIQTDNRGSFWTGAILRNGVVLAAGQRGHLYRSQDHGQRWIEIPSRTDQSLTDIRQLDNGLVVIVGLGGVVLVSKDQGHSLSFENIRRRTALTAIGVAADQKVTLFGLDGYCCVLP